MLAGNGRAARVDLHQDFSPTQFVFVTTQNAGHNMRVQQDACAD
jgi:hypothetical protein